MRRKSGPRESTIVNHEEGELKKNHPLLEARHAWVRRGIKLCFENLSTNDHKSTMAVEEPLGDPGARVFEVFLKVSQTMAFRVFDL